MAIKDTITNAAAITILQPIDNNYKTGGGDISVAGCLIVASKGKPSTPIPVYGGTTDILDNFGTPLSKKAIGMEGLRHVHDASESCSYVQTVRIVDTATYRYPSLSFLVYNPEVNLWKDGEEYREGALVDHDGKTWLCAYSHTADSTNAPDAPDQTDWLEFKGAAETNTHRHNETVMVGEGAFLVIYPIDGDSSANRSIRFTDIDTENKRFKLSIWDKDELGEPYELETHLVGVDENDKDDMGLSAYIETVFERESDRFRVDYMEGINWESILPVLEENAYTRTRFTEFFISGGTAGEDPQIDDWQLGANVFRNDRVALNLLFAAGIYEQDVITNLAKVADERHIAFFYDVPPALKADEAMEWDKSLGLTSRHARAYYSPYSANDQWRGGKCVWGVSGAMAAAKARCNKIVTAGSTPGVH